MKHKYLLELLQNNKTVIVPGLGAFVKNESASQPFVFNEYLKFDDGLVASFIAKKENISIPDAGKKLQVFVQGMLSLLDSGKEVTITAIGRLKKNDKGKLEFTSDTSAQETKEVVQEKPVSPQPEKKPEPELKKEVVTPAPVPPVVKQEPAKPKPVTPEPEKPVVKQEQPIDLKKESAPKETKVAAAPKKKKKEKAPKKEKEGKKRNWVLLIILLIIIGGGGTAGFIFKDEIMKMVSGKQTAVTTNSEQKEPEQNTELSNTDSTATGEEAEYTEGEMETSETPDTGEEVIVEEDAVAVEVAPVEEKKPIEKKTVPAPTPVSSATSGMYYIIVGCYREQSNADAMISRINTEGLSGQNLGMYGGLYHIAAWSGSSMEEATSKVNSINSKFPGAWVFRKR